MPDLPAELWIQVFELAADEDVIFQHALPTSMAESAWFKNDVGDWDLRSPQDAIEELERRSYSTKVQAIIRTCKKWQSIGFEFLFRSLFFSKPAHLLERCAALDSSSASATTATHSLGWWTRRIHLTRGITFTPTADTLRNALASIIRHCPNLEIFVVDGTMGSATFGPVAEALATFSKKSLRTFDVNIPSSALPKLIWALDSLPNLFAVHVDVQNSDVRETPQAGDETPLGAACDIQLGLPDLRQLSLRGHLQQLVEQATGWQLPSLRSLSINTSERPSDLPDVLAFLAAHGTSLDFLDVYLKPRQSVPRFLAACPALTTLIFNWRLAYLWGCTGLLRAFGFDPALDKMNEVSADVALTISVNERTFDALCTKEFFPSLTRIRAVDPDLLRQLNLDNGPREAGGGMTRWENWWATTTWAGIRLEDCTGNFLGELPQDEAEGTGSD
ncbi:hypothetical protein C8F01DRAFT_1221349 [Mycena amicta]|nr:hypothetical protein C8F01DRAFT_1221349 [Mycena amicta]